MRILWVKVGGLWPLTTGGRLRSFHTIEELSRRHRVTVLTTHGPDDDHVALAERLSRCEGVRSFPYVAAKRNSLQFGLALARSWFSRYPVDLRKWRVPALRNEVMRLAAAHEVDVCVADFLFAVPNVPSPISIPMIFFEHNVEHIIWKRLCQIETRPWRRLLLELEWRKVRKIEAEACRRASVTMAVSEEDRRLLLAIAPGSRVAAIPTGVDTVYFAPNGIHEDPARLVFTGSMDWFPNEDAILHAIENILPLIRSEMPEASLTVAGRNPTSRLRVAAAHAGVRMTGTVEDVRPYIAEAAVYVVPLRVGGGTRLKILEALAMGKAVVSTTVGAEGLPLVPGKHFLRADDPREFAGAVLTLLRDPDRRRALGSEGRRLLEQRFSWPQVVREFEVRCQEAAA
jgi:glycosyltransferase involved in cell wall biosynthesis